MAEKTEAPTPRRRDEARSKGQGVGRSWEFSMGLTLGVGTLALASLLPGMAAALVTRTQMAVTDMSPDATNAQLVNETGGAILQVLTLILPLAVLVMVAGVAGNIVSGGLVFSPKAIRFDMSRVNPMKGLKRIVDKQALVRLGLSSAKLAILATISWQVVGSRVPAIVSTQGSSATAIAGTCLSAIFQLGLTITILLAVVALIDFVVQRRRATESIRMTKEEVKREYRESEGDPQIRGARRRRARQMAFARMMDAVPTADVVVTNPTTLAVALKYDSLTMRAPKIVAKGQRLMAERIKVLAREHRVPVIEDKPLARALFSRPVGSEVPAHLYRAVARLLVLVHQARFGAARGAGAGAQRGRQGHAGPARGAAGTLALRTWSAAPGAWAGGDTLHGRGPEGRGVDPAAAALMYGGAAESGYRPTDAAGDPEEAWLGEGALGPEEVDEDALAVALSEDELADMTPDELARLEAGLALGDDSTGLDEEQER